MDTVFAQAVSQIAELPLDTQRVIGETLLGGHKQPDLPVIHLTAEEEAMVGEGLADLEAGRVHDQQEMAAHFAALRDKTSAHVL